MVNSINSSLYMDDLIQRIVNRISTYPEKKCLASIILTGSLGREEGTFHLSNDYQLVLDSDVELALVYKRGQKKLAESIKEKLIRDFKEDMNPMTISYDRVKMGYNFNYSILTPERSSIFMYDLYNGSKTIWGKRILPKKIAPYDKYEAKRIVANRIGELIYLESTQMDLYGKTTKQWEAKLLLAIGSALCILENKYHSKYSEQRDFIISHAARFDKIFGENFSKDYNSAYMFLRKGNDTFEISRDVLQKYVGKIKNQYLEHDIHVPKINSFSRRIKYAISCIKTGAGLNPFTCEEDIIEYLIYGFSTNDQALTQMARKWKSILY